MTSCNLSSYGSVWDRSVTVRDESEKRALAVRMTGQYIMINKNLTQGVRGRLGPFRYMDHWPPGPLAPQI